MHRKIFDLWDWGEEVELKRLRETENRISTKNRGRSRTEEKEGERDRS